MVGTTANFRGGRQSLSIVILWRSLIKKRRRRRRREKGRLERRETL